MKILLRFMSVLPLCMLHGMGWLLGWWVFIFSSVYRKRLVANAQQAGMGRSVWLRSVGQAGQLACELPRLWMGRAVPIEWQGSEHVETAIAQGRGIVYLTPHLGCFEITAQALANRFGAVQPLTVMYKPAKQAWLNDLIQKVRARDGLVAVPTLMSGVKQMIKALRSGQSVGLLPDQVPPNGMGVWAPFFGREAYTMSLSVRLIQQTGAAVLLVWGERRSWGRGYLIHVTPFDAVLADDLPTAALQINQAMEMLIAQCPQQYLWSYARYKQPRQEPI
jgi:Kdo2-lipid IVA lauroyltransferase/acyltransferase